MVTKYHIKTSKQAFSLLLLYLLGVSPHCLDPGTVHSVTVEYCCGEKWEESILAHKTIRDMSKPAAENTSQE